MVRVFTYYVLTGESKTGRPLTYTGIAYDVARRLRQHNGEITGGAAYTTRMGRGGSWTLAATVSGFNSDREARQFELGTKKACKHSDGIYLHGPWYAKCDSIRRVLRSWWRHPRPEKKNKKKQTKKVATERPRSTHLHVHWYRDPHPVVALSEWPTQVSHTLPGCTSTTGKNLPLQRDARPVLERFFLAPPEPQEGGDV